MYTTVVSCALRSCATIWSAGVGTDATRMHGVEKILYGNVGCMGG